MVAVRAAADEIVGSRVSSDRIVAAVALQQVVAIAAEEQVIAGLAVEQIVVVISQQRVVAADDQRVMRVNIEQDARVVPDALVVAVLPPLTPTRFGRVSG